MSDMVYKWRSGSRVGIDAQKAGERLEDIRVKHNGRLTPDAVVEDAKKKRSPLHDHFEWDDSEAAKEYRKEQAGYLIRSIAVVFQKDDDQQPVTTRAFLSVDRDEDRSYTSLAHAMSDEELRTQVLQKAWAELQAFKQRYSEYEELAGLFAAIDANKPTLLAG